MSFILLVRNAQKEKETLKFLSNFFFKRNYLLVEHTFFQKYSMLLSTHCVCVYIIVADNVLGTPTAMNTIPLLSS
jgi:hypothetical protein